VAKRRTDNPLKINLPVEAALGTHPEGQPVHENKPHRKDRDVWSSVRIGDVVRVRVPARPSHVQSKRVPARPPASCGHSGRLGTFTDTSRGWSFFPDSVDASGVLRAVDRGRAGRARLWASPKVVREL